MEFVLNISIPDGVRVFNRAETYQLNIILDKVRNIFEKWGYDQIFLPSFEYFDVHEKGLGKDISKKVFKLVDRNTGDILALRADITSQIARYFSSLKNKSLPKRYFYMERVFRYESPKAGNLWERIQAGIELIGSKRLEADAEIIAVAAKTLKELGLEDFQIDINNIQLFKGIKKLLSLDNRSFSDFMSYIKFREIYNLENFCNELSVEKNLKEFLINIPRYQGDISLIKELRRKISTYRELEESFLQLEKIYSILEVYNLSDRVVFDLGEPKEFSYYTGIVFEIFVKDFEKPLGQGGRYDNLIGKYNGDFSATGFAFDIYNIWECLKKKNLLPEYRKKDFFIIDISEDKEIALSIARELREKNYTVARDIIDRDYKESIEFAFNEGFKYVLLIGVDRDKESIYIVTPEKKKKVKIKDFLEKV